ncbi:hypothetical protein V5799_012510 [Amblyomma americanum]|uniref:Uncharacterized protein n=1 Tax=Amblyomma americanum TaxID=6943 RepID=A0AAQ4EDT9_AMBAM
MVQGQRSNGFPTQPRIILTVLASWQKRSGRAAAAAVFLLALAASAEWPTLDCGQFGELGSSACNCTVHDRTPTNQSRNQVWITCSNVSSLEELNRILAPARRHRFDKFQLGVSTLGHLPSNLFLDTPVSEVHLWDTALASFVQGESDDALLGLQRTLRSLALRRCSLDSSQPFHRHAPLSSLPPA